MFEEIRELISENLGIAKKEINMDSRLKEDLGADSLDAVEIAMIVEERHNVQIEDEDLQRLEVVGDIVKALEDKVN